MSKTPGVVFNRFITEGKCEECIARHVLSGIPGNEQARMFPDEKPGKDHTLKVFWTNRGPAMWLGGSYVEWISLNGYWLHDVEWFRHIPPNVENRKQYDSVG